MQHPNKHTCNILLKKQMKHLEQTLVTYMYSHCNICNIPIYFCNISMTHLQHTSETSETFEIYACNMRFQQNLVDGRTEHCTAVSGYAIAVEKEDDSAQAGVLLPASGTRSGGSSGGRAGAAS
jgi:hypothetical protein